MTADVQAGGYPSIPSASHRTGSRYRDDKDSSMIISPRNSGDHDGYQQVLEHRQLSSPIPITFPTLVENVKTTLMRLPRRRSSLGRITQRKPTHIIAAISLPILVLLILAELSIHETRLAASVQPPVHLLPSTPQLDIWRLRAEYGRDRRRIVSEQRMAQLGPTRRRLVARARVDYTEDGDAVRSLGWTEEDEAKLKQEVEDVWPEWWGNVDDVGPSPFDHVPAINGKRRILFLTDYNDYLERMNTHTYEIVDAALRHPNVIVDVWGPGWKGYDRSLPLSVNVKRRQARIDQLETSKAEHDSQVRQQAEAAFSSSWFVDAESTAPEPVKEWEEPEWTILEDETACGPVVFDAVWTISDIFKQDDPHVDVLDCGALLVQQLGDCHSHRCMQEWYPMANNITLSKYAFELPEIFDPQAFKAKFPEFHMGIFGHSPDTGNEWDFWPVPWANKTSDAKTFGYDGSFYPIRTTVTDYARDDPKATIERHEHPGYVVSTPDHARQHPLETYTKSHELYKTHEKLREEFATGMRHAKICVFDASLERKLIRKYAQALLSGCVIAADLPTEHEEALETFTIKLQPSWDIARIKEEIDSYLDQPERLHQMALDGFIYARQHLTTTRKVTDLIRMVDAHRAGTRGFVFPHSFSLRCRAYWSDDDSYRPPWCDRSGGHRGLEG